MIKISVIVTGGAGFVGSCIIKTLNDMGIDEIYIVDNISKTEKWKNLTNKKFTEYIHKDYFFSRLPYIDNVTHIIHMGACSNTTENNFDYLYVNNFEYSKKLWVYCSEHHISYIYASSAATYGSGELGFSDEIVLDKLLPLNGYGYSKHLFDLWTQKQTCMPEQHVGLKFFNVYGPNEYCKGPMASVIFRGFNQIKQEGALKLFKSYNPGYKDGGQLRDFLYVRDVCDVVKFFLENKKISGLFNVGSGKAESFETLGESIYKTLNIPLDIEYIDMPDKLRDKYQYFTEADIEKLRSVGYKQRFYPLDEGIYDYVSRYLNKDFLVY